jgi:hypothetical protein
MELRLVLSNFAYPTYLFILIYYSQFLEVGVFQYSKSILKLKEMKRSIPPNS